MSYFEYKTRGNCDPQGKSKVYFCCHPKDFSRCFESISDEILAKQNCAIWYIDGSVDRNEDFFENLQQMQLFVMPITSNLLCTENDALDVDFKFAVEKHIPVLPLMQEPGLEKLFNQKCGDLQYLDKNNRDVTAISYDEKLRNYLESILVGDELAENIRAAFDTYVFLSYRKKDRKHAQELMRLIHKNDFCRNVAIWYDEFLIPGENFNASIKEALKKSGLFVLAVTPNLINEVNYIMTTEYPLARQEGKPVLPVELLPTDRDVLFEKYNDIPNPTNAYDDSMFSKALRAVIDTNIEKKNLSSAERNYYIGLAYLSGVDVEINSEYALELITLAATDDMEDAITKLVDIYSRGVGVEKNLNTALYWQETLVRLLQRNFDKSFGVASNDKLSDGVAFFEALIRLGTLYSDGKEYSKAKESFVSAHVLVKQLQDDTILPMFLLNRSAQCLVEIACCEMREGNINSSIDLLKTAIQQYEECPLNSTIYIAKAYSLLGDALVHSDINLAIENYMQGMSLLESYLLDEDSYAAKYYLAQIYSQLAKLSDGDSTLYYDLATNYYSQASLESDDINIKLEYFWSLTQYGDFLYREDKTEGAIQKYCLLFDVAMSIVDNIEIENNESLLELVSVAYYKMFIACLERNNKDGALAFLDEAETYLICLLRIKPNDECYKRRYESIRDHISTILDS